MAKRGRPFIPALDRLADKFTVGDGCWEWTAGCSSRGYGVFELRGARVAHRVVYEMLVGPVPEGLQLDHLCRNRRCVRPDHLEPVTCRENLARSPLTNLGRARMREEDQHACQ